MHGSVNSFIQKHLRKADVFNQTVLEVGSRNINGSVRDIILPFQPEQYIGTDMEAGDGVDVVLNALDLVTMYGEESFDIVVCAEMLEHCEHWKGAIANMKSVLKPGGMILLTTRSPGYPLHEYPSDYWRFTRSDMVNIFEDFYIRTFDDPSCSGVFVVGVKPNNWVSADLSNFEVGKVGQ